MSDAIIDYNDVQGTILRGYRVHLARHFILRITDATQARKTITALLDGSDGLPQITTARHSSPKPPCFLNLSFTADGLSMLGLSKTDLLSFDQAFQRGAADPASARRVGDVGDSAPEHWLGDLGPASRAGHVHALLSLWVSESAEVLEAVSARLRRALAGGWRELYAHDAAALPDNRVHFGYRDSIAQPDVDGAPPRKHHEPDPLNSVKTGEFLLGYENESKGSYRVEPPPLSKNGSYAAFRILEQDVPLFESTLAQCADSSGLTVEMVAAKFCGRWRNGNPLVLRPDQSGPVLPDADLNRFNYVDMEQPERDDTLGLKCPIGAHIRRNNPRDEGVVGTSARNHRIVRRAMPYGAEYNPAAPVAAARGLVGYFINASLYNQFEFLMEQWNDDHSFVKSAVGPAGRAAGNANANISGQDVFLGVNDPADSSFTLPGLGPNGSGNTALRHFERSIITRAGVYCFFPSITGLRYLANLA